MSLKHILPALLPLLWVEPSGACWNISASDSGTSITLEVTVTPRASIDRKVYITVQREILEYCRSTPETIAGDPVLVPEPGSTIQFSRVDTFRLAGKSYRYRLRFVDAHGREVTPSSLCPAIDEQPHPPPNCWDFATREAGLIFLGEGVPRAVNYQQYVLEPCRPSCNRPYELVIVPSEPVLFEYADQSSLPVIVYGREYSTCSSEARGFALRLWWASCAVANELHTWSALKARY